MLLHCDDQGNLHVTAHWTHDSANLWQAVPILMKRVSDSPFLCQSPASLKYRIASDSLISSTPYYPDIQIFQSSKLINKNASIKITKGSGIEASSASNILYGQVYSADAGGLWYAMAPTGGTAECLWDNEQEFTYWQDDTTTRDVSSGSFEPSFTYINWNPPTSRPTVDTVYCYSYAMAVNIVGARVGIWTNLEHVIPFQKTTGTPDFHTNIRDILGLTTTGYFTIIDPYDSLYSSKLIWNKESDVVSASQSFLFRGSLYMHSGDTCPIRSVTAVFSPPWIKFKPTNLNFIGENTECTININFCEVTEAYWVR